MISFKRSRAKARRLILESKKSSWEKYVSSITTETTISEVWKKIKTISGKRFSPSSRVLLENNQTIFDAKEIPNVLARQFSVARSTNNYEPAFKQIKERQEKDLDFSETDISDINIPFSMEEFKFALENSKNSAPGPDDIPYEILQHIPDAEKLKLLSLINKIWQESTYPNTWRNAIIVPIAKPNKDSKLPSSYRPISLTCCLSKLMEKMVNNRLVWYLETNHLLDDHQMGFRKNRSTIDNLVLIENYIQTTFAKRSHLVAVSFDLEKAYDSTWRFGILKKLHSWGIRGHLPKFIESFLTNRRFSVRMGGHLSDEFFLENGVPQGSTLSVTLFAIAINDLTSAIDHHVGKYLFVDDLLIFYAAKSMDDIEQKLQENINKINEEAANIGFRFSPSKTKAIHFCRLRKPHASPQLYLNNVLIECVPTIKLLGMTFDSKLTWAPHINELATKCKKSLNVIRCMANINWGSNREVLLRAYTSLVLSKIDYGSLVYSSARKSRLRILNSIHCSGLRMAIGAFRTSPLHSICCEAGIPPLKHRRNRLLLNYTSKIWALPHHPVHNIFFENDLIHVYEARPSITRPAGIRAKTLLHTLDIELPEVFPLGFSETPPWRLSNPNTRYDLTAYPKKETNPCLIKNKFQEIVNEYDGAAVMYTDGSKTEHGVGCALVTPEETRTWKLPAAASVYTAELYSIYQALLLSENLNSYTIAICTDSLSSLQAVDDTFSRDPLVQKILSLVTQLLQSNKEVVFIWVPSHIGIAGNEEADRAAREASNAERNNIENNLQIRPSDLKPLFAKETERQWQSEWDATTAKLRTIKHQVTKWTMPCKLSRREQVAVTRLRIGHTRMTSTYLLRGEQQPRCTTCNEVLTINHIIMDCIEFRRHRQMLGIPGHIRDCLKNDKAGIKKTLEYVKSIGIFLKI